MMTYEAIVAVANNDKLILTPCLWQNINPSLHATICKRLKMLFVCKGILLWRLSSWLFQVHTVDRCVSSWCQCKFIFVSDCEPNDDDMIKSLNEYFWSTMF